MIEDFGVTYLEAQKKMNGHVRSKKEKYLIIPSQGVTKLKSMKPFIIEGSLKVKELPQAQDIVEECIEAHEEEGAFNGESFCFKNERKSTIKLEKKK